MLWALIVPPPSHEGTVLGGWGHRCDRQPTDGSAARIMLRRAGVAVFTQLASAL